MKFVPVLFLGILISLTSHATGGVNGGGGKAVVCRSADGQVQTAQLLDLYEGPELFDLEIRKGTGDETLDYRNAMSRYFDHFNDSVWVPGTSQASKDSTFDYFVETFFIEKIKFINLPEKLQKLPDSMEPVLPGGCSAEQLAIYYLDEKILVQKEIWDHLDSFNRSALMIHEIFYHLRRIDWLDEDSRRARRFVAYLFSTTPLSSSAKEFAELKGTSVIECGRSSGAYKKPESRFDFKIVKSCSPGEGCYENVYFKKIDGGFLESISSGIPDTFGHSSVMKVPSEFIIRNKFEDENLHVGITPLSKKNKLLIQVQKPNGVWVKEEVSCKKVR